MNILDFVIKLLKTSELEVSSPSSEAKEKAYGKETLLCTYCVSLTVLGSSDLQE